MSGFSFPAGKWAGGGVMSGISAAPGVQDITWEVLDQLAVGQGIVMANVALNEAHESQESHMYSQEHYVYPHLTGEIAAHRGTVASLPFFRVTGLCTATSAHSIVSQLFNGFAAPDDCKSTAQCNGMEMNRAVNEMERTLQTLEDLNPFVGYVEMAYAPIPGERTNRAMQVAGTMQFSNTSSVAVVPGDAVGFALPIPPQFRYADEMARRYNREKIMLPAVGGSSSQPRAFYQMYRLDRTNAKASSGSTRIQAALKAEIAAVRGKSFLTAGPAKSQVGPAIAAIAYKVIHGLVVSGHLDITARVPGDLATECAPLRADLIGTRSAATKTTDVDKRLLMLAHHMGVGRGAGYGSTSTGLYRSILENAISATAPVTAEDSANLGDDGVKVVRGLRKFLANQPRAIAQASAAAADVVSLKKTGLVISGNKPGQITDVLMG